MTWEDRDWSELLFEARDFPQRFFADPHYPDGMKAHAAMQVALVDRLNNQKQRINFDAAALEDSLPRWPTPGVPHLMKHCGGGYGLSVLLGGEKCGKTFFALSQCIEAAATTQWQVVYVSAELDDQELAFRIASYLQSNPGSLDAAGYFHVIHVGKGQKPFDLYCDIAMCTDPNGPPVLVCLDSINTIAEMSGGDYLRTLRDYAMWMMVSRRMSNGMVSFLCVSETNRLGQAKGGNLQFWADQVVKLKKCKQVSGFGGLRPTQISLLSSRRTDGEGSMGTYLRNMNKCQFEEYMPDDRVSPIRSAEPLRLRGA